MHFLQPAWLLLLLVVVALLVGYVGLQLRRTKYVARFSNLELLGSVAPRRPGWRRHLTFAFLLAGLSVLSVGVAQPVAAERVPRDRATVMLAIDVSLSMEATDVLPSRIQAAKTAATDFVGLLPSRINLGLVDFGGSANLLVSPTLDRVPVTKAIKGMQLQNSTAIGQAILTSLQAISNFSQTTTVAGSKPPPARIVLLSDGSNTVGPSLDTAVAAAKKAGVEVSTIAFGTQDGTVTYRGETIPVPADDDALAQIAAQTGGTFHTAHTVGELESVYHNIGSQIGYMTRHHEISWRFLMIGLLLAFGAAGSSMLWSGRLA
ncbi:VWA domain-containing protein [Jatrophihabitans sp.]|uniref:VWA domain-containing protein n=1 Tax=Jatrophihabitans sp. TaxID=1932789 RepID=UPI0030C6FB05|nr:Ca-activated chloride channel family protein [Jatrophihabitans sp.]